MVTVFDVDPHELINKLKDELKSLKEVKKPEWAKYVKSGSSRNKPPEQEDFWHIRAASILRQLYVEGRPLGVQRLRVKYGRKEQNSHKPAHQRKAGGKIIRTILQQLENEELIKKDKIKGKKGRVITKEGKSFVDKIAAQIKKGE